MDRVEESAKWSGQAQFEEAKKWRSVNLVLGAPASILAALTGVTVLASTTSKVWAGVCALLAAALGALLTSVNASHRMNQATASANAYLEIQSACRQARLIDLPVIATADARSLLGELTARRDEQNKTAYPPSRRSYAKARKNIKSGGQDYTADATNEGDAGATHG